MEKRRNEMKEESGFTRHDMRALSDAAAGLPHSWTTGRLATSESHLSDKRAVAGSTSPEDASDLASFTNKQQETSGGKSV
jgi:hypothetical protein